MKDKHERKDIMNTNSKEILNIKELVETANKFGYSISEYTVRRAIRSGDIPCRKIGRTYLIMWTKFVDWITCSTIK